MKIKQKDGVKAYKVLKKLNEQETNGTTALHIFNAMNALQPVWDFQVQEEKKIIEKHPNFDPFTGSIKTSEDQDADSISAEVQALNKEFTDLAELDVDANMDPFKIDLTLADSLKLSGKDIKDLSGFVEFE